MSRMIDRMLAQCRKDGRTAVADELSQMRVFVIDNVADYYFAGTDQEIWFLDTDFPNVAPPFERFFVEFKAPNRIVSREFGTMVWKESERKDEAGYGFMAYGVDKQHLTEIPAAERFLRERRIPLDEVAWVLGLAMFRERRSSGCDQKPVFIRWFAVRPDGSIWYNKAEPSQQQPGHFIVPSFIGSPIVDDFYDDIAAMHREPTDAERAQLDDLTRVISEGYAGTMQVVLLALSFLHCKNVKMQPVRPEPKLSRAYRRRHGQELVSYHTLDITPMRAVMAAPAADGSGPAGKKALHIARGHFKTFDERPLFGRWKGVFWWSPMVRGTGPRKVVTDFRVNAPEVPQGS